MGLDGRALCRRNRCLLLIPVSETENVSFDAVTAELQINEQAAAPLLCVTGVHDIASGDLSLPGRVTANQ